MKPWLDTSLPKEFDPMLWESKFRYGFSMVKCNLKTMTLGGIVKQLGNKGKLYPQEDFKQLPTLFSVIRHWSLRLS